MHKGFGVQVTIPSLEGRGATTTPLAVVARDERDAELVAAAAAGGGSAQVIRELSHDETVDYGLDLGRHGDVKALPALNL